MSQPEMPGIGHNFPPQENLLDRGAPCFILQRADGSIEIKGPSYVRVANEAAKYPHSFGSINEEAEGRWCIRGSR